MIRTVQKIGELVKKAKKGQNTLNSISHEPVIVETSFIPHFVHKSHSAYGALFIVYFTDDQIGPKMCLEVNNMGWEVKKG